MSEENVALVRSVYENFMSGDIAAVLAALDPDVVWVEGDQRFLPHRGTHRGPDAVVSGVFEPTADAWQEFAVIPERFHDAGEVVTVEGRLTGRSRAGGTLDCPAAWVWTVRGGRIVSNVNYHDTEALRVALDGWAGPSSRS